jgi:uncharacterized protein with LGFP repeats
MKIKYQITFILLTLTLFSACNSKEKQQKLADLRLKHIEQLINDNALNAAKIEIDSIHLLFPRMVDKRRAAEALKDTVIRRENARTLAYCDSILPVKLQEADAIQKNFRLEKNAKYQQVGSYIYKTQQTENNINRTYLKAFVDENADLYLVSNYCGGKIEHSSLEVSVNDLFAKTDTIDTSNASNHSFTDEGTRWENVTFKNQADKGVTAFITQYTSEKIKVTLHGKKSYTYYLENADKKAIAETYHLWVVKKDVAQLQKEIKKATLKIERIVKGRKN